MYLVDSSVWIEVFRKPSGLSFEEVIDIDTVVTCLPVMQEVLQGFADETAYRTASEALHALPLLESPLTSEVFEEAVSLYRRGRQAGVTIRSSVDCLIAACAIRQDVTVVHRDRDFDALATISGLRVRRV